MIQLLLRRNLTKQPQSYIKLIVCLVSAIFMISCVLIFRDSTDYGRQQQLLQTTNGADFALVQAEESVTSFFQSEPFHAWYENGNVYLTLTRGADAEEALRTIRSTLERQGIDIEVQNYYYLNHTESEEQYSLLLLLVAIVLFVLGLAVVVMMVQVFLQGRRREVGILYAIGAQPKQVNLVLRLELLIVTAAALLLGIGLANLVMALSIRQYLRVENDAFAHIVYHYSLWSFLFTILLVLCICLVTSEFCLWKLKKMAPITGDCAEEGRLAERVAMGDGERSFSLFFSLSSLLRSPGHVLRCFATTIPFLVLVMVVSAYTGLYTPEVDAAKQGDLVFYRNMESEKILTLEEWNAILSERSDVEQSSYYIYRTDYSVVREEPLNLASSSRAADDLEYTPAEFGVMEEAQFSSFGVTGEREDFFAGGASLVCVVPENFGYSLGDQVILSREDETIALTVVGIYRYTGDKAALKLFPVYVPLAVYEQTTGEKAVPYTVSVELKEGRLGSDLISLLTEEGAYTVRDNVRNEVDYASIYRGVTRILLFFQVLVCVSGGVLLFSYISLFVERHKNTISVLYKIGCSETEIKKLYAKMYFMLFLTAALIALLLGGVFSQWMAASLYQSLIFNAETILPPALTLVTFCAVSIGSAVCMVGRVLKKEG